MEAVQAALTLFEQTRELFLVDLLRHVEVLEERPRVGRPLERRRRYGRRRLGIRFRAGFARNRLRLGLRRRRIRFLQIANPASDRVPDRRRDGDRAVAFVETFDDRPWRLTGAGAFDDPLGGGLELLPHAPVTPLQLAHPPAGAACSAPASSGVSCGRRGRGASRTSGSARRRPSSACSNCAMRASASSNSAVLMRR